MTHTALPDDAQQLHQFEILVAHHDKIDAEQKRILQQAMEIAGPMPADTDHVLEAAIRWQEPWQNLEDRDRSKIMWGEAA